MFKKELLRIGMIMTVLYLVFSAIFYVILDRYYLKTQMIDARHSLNFNKAIAAYVSDVQKPFVLKLTSQLEDSDNFFDPSLLSSTFIANHINAEFQRLSEQDNQTHHSGPVIKFASDNPTNLSNKSTPLESQILKRFNDENLSHYTSTMIKDGERHLFYALPIRPNTEKCMRCHSTPERAPADMVARYGDQNGFGEKVGDIRALVAIYTPLDTADDDKFFFFCLIEIIMLVIFVLIFFLNYYYLGKISRKDKLIAKQSQFAAMGEMIGMIAHQWRQPITGIGMTVENMKLDIELQTIDETQWETNLTTISKQIHYLSHTIDDFRNFFRPGQKPTPSNINTVLDDSLQVIASTINKQNITIQRRYGDLPEIYSYRNELLQVFLNLLKNSKDAYVERNLEKRPITIETTYKEEHTIITFTDHAGGIKEEVIEHIFDPYFSTKDTKIGTGIGLYMSKMIIEDHHGGTITATSIDDSTTFTITLPNQLHTTGEEDYGN